MESLASGANIKVIMDKRFNAISDTDALAAEVAAWTIAGAVAAFADSHYKGKDIDPRIIAAASVTINVEAAKKSAELVGMQVAEGKYFDAFSSTWNYIGAGGNAVGSFINAALPQFDSSKVSKSVAEAFSKIVDSRSAILIGAGAGDAIDLLNKQTKMLGKTAGAAARIGTIYTVGSSVIAPQVADYLGTDEGQAFLDEVIKWQNLGIPAKYPVTPPAVLTSALYSHRNYEIYRQIGEKYDDLVSKTTDAMESAHNAYKQAKRDFDESWDNFKDSVNGLIKDAQSTADEFSKEANESWDKFKQASQEIYDGMVDNASEKIEDAANFAQEMSQKLQDAAKSLEQDLKDAGEAASNAAKDLAERAKQAAEDVAQAAKEAYEQAKSAAEQAAKAARDFFDNLPNFDDLWEDFKNLFPDPNNWLPEWAKDLADWLDDGKVNRDGKYHIYDPIALDLNGDGIQALATNGFTGALFDHDNDSIRTATGWVAGGDGLLVRDLNGNGMIDNGSELFGDNTALADGSLAQHGYAALAELDENADGQVNAADSAFATLRVWQDANQDGISQANELRTLVEAGVESLNTAFTDVNKDLGNGNSIAQLGSYTKTDGSTAEMGDLLFTNDALYSRFTDQIELTTEQAQVANLSGLGRLRDLREAAVVSGDLSAALQAYSTATTKQEQLALLDKLVHEWAETDPQWGKREFKLGTTFTETNNEGRALTPSQVSQLRNGLIFFSDETQAAIDAARDRMAVLDAFTGQDSSRLFLFSEEDAKNVLKITNDTYASLTDNVYKGLLFQTRLQPYLNEIAFKIENEQFVLDFSRVVATFNQVHETNPQKAVVDLAEFMGYAKMDLAQTGLSELLAHYFAVADETTLVQSVEMLDKAVMDNLGLHFASTDKINLSGNSKDDFLIGDKGNNTLTANDGNDTLIGGTGNDTLNGGWGGDTYVFAKGHGQDVINDYGSEKDTIRFVDVASTEVKFRKDGGHLIIEGYGEQDSVQVNNFFNGSYYQLETFQFSDKTVTLQEYAENGLTLQGLGTDDTVSGWGGKNILLGHDGNDTLTTHSKDDTLDGGAGNDKLTANDGNDTLIGGTGNDTLNGGWGGDTYVFAKGHGQDVINDYGSEKDTIRFVDVASTEAKFRKDGGHLIIEGYGEQDSVQVNNFFNGSYYQLETFQFSDKTVTLQEYAENGLTLQGLGTDDTVSGWGGKNILLGHDGNDTLTTHSKDDTLDGGAGNDKLTANDGNDTLIGGTGNDTLNGGWGGDTYVFAKGHGQDVINDYGSEKDTIRFVDVASTEAKFRKDGGHLIIEGYGEQDSVQVNNFFNGSYYQLETFQFSDKTVTLQEYAENGLTLQGLDTDDTVSGWEGKNILLGHDGNDTLTTYSKDDTLDGGAGNDKLTANDGNDTLIGGTGNDTLNGGWGGDTYVFAKGHGQDVINDYGSEKDTIRFVDVASTEAKFRKDGGHLIIEGYGEQDSVQVNNFFNGSYFQLETFQFSDKTVTLQEYAENGLTLQGLDADDTVSGWGGKNILLGHDGNDTLTTHSKDDTLDGGAGNDTLTANDGNDTLIGGTGNDTLNGGWGEDTYVFAKGHGQDVINDYGSETDTFVLTNVALSEMMLGKQNADLLLINQNTQDSVAIKNFFSHSYYQVEKLVFEDQTVQLDVTELNHALSGTTSMVNAMAAFSTNSQAITSTDWTSDALKNIPVMLVASS